MMTPHDSRMSTNPRSMEETRDSSGSPDLRTIAFQPLFAQ
jgi:hypothetical protein